MHRKTAKRLFITLLLVIVAAIPACVLVWGAVQEQLDRPLGPTLSVQYAMPTVGAFADPVAAPAIAADPELLLSGGANLPVVAPAKADPTISATPSSESIKPEPMCGGPASMVILAIGSDSGPGRAGGRSDVTRGIRVDFVDATITLIAFPRDLWVSIPGLEAHGIYEHRVNAAYSYGDFYEVPGGGPTLLAQTLYLNFGLVVDHYMAIDMGTFAEAVDALGGVDFYLDKPVDGRTQGLPYFGAGWHHLNGDQVVRFARIRYPDTDFHRIQRQTDVLMALRNRVLEPQNWGRIPDLVKIFLDDTRTDLSSAEIASLICLAPKVEPEAIQSLSVTREMTTSWTTNQGANVLLPHVEQIRELVATFMGGEPVEATSD